MNLPLVNAEKAARANGAGEEKDKGVEKTKCAALHLIYEDRIRSRSDWGDIMLWPNSPILQTTNRSYFSPTGVATNWCPNFQAEKCLARAGTEVFLGLTL